MNHKVVAVFQIISTIIWYLLLSPAILVIFAQKTIHPALTDVFTLSDIIYLSAEIFNTPGEYYAWILSAIIPNLGDSGVIALLISILLFTPFILWPFLKPERHYLLRKMLRMATMAFVALCVVSVLFLFAVDF